MNPKYFIGPMSKNIVDTIIEFCEETNNIIGLIPSRRQIEYDGGYVNNWKTYDFSNYVKSKTNKIILQRDHSGPGQGENDDDGYISLKEDCKNFDLIHIDPWKKYNQYSDGLKWTIDMIKYCDNINDNLQYEIGTEESIKKFSSEDLERLIVDLKSELIENQFSKIKYLVIQSGTSLKSTNQTGNYDSERLKSMIEVAKKYGLMTKEHNGDYIPVDIIKDKFSIGLDSINIAPEFGLIETETYLENIKKISIFDKYWDLCFKSNKWIKWVEPNFNPYENKKELIRICGHYVLSNEEFLSEIKQNFKNIDSEIKFNIKTKLKHLYE